MPRPDEPRPPLFTWRKTAHFAVVTLIALLIVVALLSVIVGLQV